MATPAQAAIIRQLAARLAEASKAVTPYSSQLAVQAEAEAQALLAAKAAEFGVPLAEATVTYGAPAAEVAGGGILGVIGSWFGYSGVSAVAVGTAVVIGTTIIVGGVVYVGSQWAGERAADKQVHAGNAMTGERPAPPPNRPPDLPENKPIWGGTFTLVDTKVTISELRNKWEVDADAGLATLVLDGNTAKYHWTVPKVITESGTDISYDCNVIAVKNVFGKDTRQNAIISASGQGLQFSLAYNDRVVDITAESSGTANLSGRKTMQIKAPVSATEVKLIIGSGYSVNAEYTYRRAK